MTLHILMISLSDGILRGWGNVQARHQDYADRVAHIHMIAYSPASHGFDVTSLSPQLTVYPTRSTNRLRFLWDAVRIGRVIIAQHPVDVITTQDPFITGAVGVWLKRITGTALHVQNHSDVFDNTVWLNEKLRNRVFHRLGRWIIQQADVNRVVNTTEHAKYVHMGLPTERVVVCPVPITLDHFTPAAEAHDEPRTSLNIPPDAPVLLWVGRPVHFKRLPLLLTAFALIHEHRPDAILVLVGEVDAALIPPTLTEAVRLPGKVDHHHLPEMYRLCDVYLHTSIYEGFGMVMVEAGACGKPVVATRSAGALDIIIDGETGLLCPLEDAQAIAQNALNLLNNPHEARTMGQHAAHYVREAFDYDDSIDRIVASWHKAAECES